MEHLTSRIRGSAEHVESWSPGTEATPSHVLMWADVGMPLLVWLFIYNGVVLRCWPGEFPTCKDKAGPLGWMRKDPSQLWPLNKRVLPHTFQGPRALLVYRPKGWMHPAFLSNPCPRGDPAHSVFFHPIQWLQLARLLISDICETALRIKSSRLAWVT